jgi:hypothetical protein
MADGSTARPEVIDASEVPRAGGAGNNLIVHRRTPIVTESMKDDVRCLLTAAAGHRCRELHLFRIKDREIQDQLAKFPVPSEPAGLESLAPRLLQLVADDAIDRPSGERHAYVLQGKTNEGEVLVSTRIRMSGGTTEGTPESLEPTSQGQVRQLMRHVEALQSMFQKQWEATTGLLGSELKESRNENRELRDSLRAQADRELAIVRQEKVQAAEVELAKAEAAEASARAAATREMTEKLGLTLPILFRQFGMHLMKQNRAAKAAGGGGPAAQATSEAAAADAPTPPADGPIRPSAELAKALATITDQQIAQLTSHGFTPQQVDAFEQARQGVDLRPLIAAADTLLPPQYVAIYALLTAEQVAALEEAIPT